MHKYIAFIAGVPFFEFVAEDISDILPENSYKTIQRNTEIAPEFTEYYEILASSKCNTNGGIVYFMAGVVIGKFESNSNVQ